MFEPHQVRLDPVPGVTDFEADGLPRVFDDHLDQETYLHVRGNPKEADKSAPISPGVPRLFEAFAPPIEPVELPAYAFAPGARDYFQNAKITDAKQAVARAERELQKLRERQDIATESQAESAGESFELVDDFEKPNGKAWELIGDGWEYRSGALHQTIPTRERFMVRCRDSIPRDFDLTCWYTTTGGTTYKSVTFRFDQSEDGKYENFVYSSAHEAGPKVHAAYTRDGKSSYPNEGRIAKPIKVGQAYKLRLAVRQTLVNVWLDDEFIKAYRFPDREHSGSLSLSAFDATVAF